MEDTNVVEVINPKNKRKVSYYLDPRLKKRLDDRVIPILNRGKDDDCVICLDGKERAGKSTLALQLAKYVDPTFCLKRVVFNPEEFRDAVFKADKGQAIVYDEAFNGLSSRASLSGVNKYLISLMMQMGQKNLFIIIVLPTFFLLDKYAALFRTKFLIHVYRSKKTQQRGYFRLYNQKKKIALYLGGRQAYTYNVKEAYTKFKGRFYGVFALDEDNAEEKYRKKKEVALNETEKTPMNAGQVKYREQRDLIIYLFKKYTKMKLKEISNLLLDYNVEISYNHISEICSKFGDVSAKAEKIQEDKALDQEPTISENDTSNL